MIIKVCGITRKEQYEELVELGVDMIGFNFYKPSSRYLREAINGVKGRSLHVGIFVNPSEDEIIKAAELHDLDLIQLHGNETVEFTKNIARRFSVIKVFGVDDQFDYKKTKEYEQYAEYFLFDTKTPGFGGSGKKFTWQQLAEYDGDTPFLLSGGIQPDDADIILKMNHDKFAGVDINSGFESAPGYKKIDQVHRFTKKLRQ